MKIIALKSIRNFHPTQACLSFIPHLPRALFSGKRVLLSRLLFLGKINNMTQSVINLYLTIILFSFMMHPSLQPYLVRNEKHFIKIFLLFLWVEWISVVVFFGSFFWPRTTPFSRTDNLRQQQKQPPHKRLFGRVVHVRRSTRSAVGVGRGEVCYSKPWWWSHRRRLYGGRHHSPRAIYRSI